MKLKYIMALADHLRPIRAKLSEDGWAVVVSAVMAFCAQSNSGFRPDEFLRYLNRRE